MSEDLVRWLTRVLDEVERVACAVVDGDRAAGYWRVDGVQPDLVIADDAGSHVASIVEIAEVGQRAGKHIAMHDPSAVLADVAAKRQIISVVMSWNHYEFCAHSDGMQGCTCNLSARMLRIIGPLAVAYTSWPGFWEQRLLVAEQLYGSLMRSCGGMRDVLGNRLPDWGGLDDGTRELWCAAAIVGREPGRRYS